MRAQKITLILLVCLSLNLYPFCESYGEQTTAGKEKIALSVFEQCRQIAQAAGDKIWPGFYFEKYAFIVENPKAGSPSIGFNLPQSETLPKNAMFHLFSDYLDSHTVEENIGIVVHEAFHMFERDPGRDGAKWRFDKPSLAIEYPDLSAENNALMNIEGAILLSALQTGDKKSLMQKVLQFASLRKFRQNKLEAEMADYEANAEANEGIAEYAGTKAVLLGLEAAKARRILIPFETYNALDYLDKKYANLKTVSRVGQSPRMRFYQTGSAQGLLLDRLMKNWKQRIQSKAEALQELIAEAVKSGGPARQSVAGVLREYGYATVLKEEEEFASKKMAERRSLLNSILVGKQGKRYIIDVSGLGKMSTKSFDPNRVFILDKEQRVHSGRSLGVAEEGRYKAQFRQPAVEDRENKRYITVSGSDQSHQVTADGVQLDLTKPVEKRFGNLTITTPNFDLEANSGVIIVTEDEVVVKLRTN